MGAEGHDLPSVAVLMSTYNGEKYIKEQVDSILGQINVEVYLYVRDDHSEDATISIIEEYADRYPDRVYLKKGENIGAGSSFMELVYEVPETFDYYAYSDQDDIWQNDKLCTSISLLKQHKKNLYMGNLMCVDKDLNELGLRNKTSPDISPYGIMVMNETNGCTMVFSNEFYLLLSDMGKRPDKMLFQKRYHDAWTAMVGAVHGDIFYDFHAHMLYRQHENNVCGAPEYQNSLKQLGRKLKKLKNKSKRNGRSRLAKEIVRIYPSEAAQYPYLNLYANPNKLKNKFKLILNYPEYKKHGPQRFFAYTMYVLLNLI